MKASIKRFIWFFGFWSIIILDEFIHYITTNEALKTNAFGSFVLLGCLVTPLFFFRDDKK